MDGNCNRGVTSNSEIIRAHYILALQSKVRGLTVHRANPRLVGCSVRALMTMRPEPYTFVNRVSVT